MKDDIQQLPDETPASSAAQATNGAGGHPAPVSAEEAAGQRRRNQSELLADLAAAEERSQARRERRELHELRAAQVTANVERLIADHAARPSLVDLARRG